MKLLEKPEKIISMSSAVIVALGLMQLLIWLAKVNRGEEQLSAVKSALLSNANAANPYLMKRSLDDLGLLVPISCVELRRKDNAKIRYFSDGASAECDRVSYSPFETRSDSFKASDGSVWEISFRSEDSREFAIVSWFVRFLAGSIAILLLELHRVRMRRLEDVKRAEIDQISRFNRVARQVAHDIRSPLSALRILESQAKWRDDSIRSLHKSALERIDSIAQEVLDYVRKNDRKIDCQPLVDANSVAEWIQEIIAEKSVQFSKHSIRFESKMVENRNLKAIEKKKFQRIISNLLNNAVEASGEYQPIKVESAMSGDSFLISILDRGTGIEPQYLELMLKGLSTKAQGTGQGLSDALETVELWGGELKVESTPGIGSRVTLFIPIHG